MATTLRAIGPGRVNLIGDHTDYNGGVALPMAIGLGVEVTWTPDATDRIEVGSDAYPGATATVPAAPARADLTAGEPAWVRLVAAMVHVAGPGTGGRLEVTSTLPTGAGLSSSAALCVALAEVFGVEGPADAIARTCQTAEHRIGVPVGLMDPLVCAGGRAGHALRIDCTTGAAEPVALDPRAGIVVVDSGVRRDLRTAPYAARVAECEEAARTIGPLGRADPADLARISDPVLARRARHVITECRRVDGVVDALGAGDLAAAGALLDEGHASLSADFAVSTPELDALVADLRARPGVLGARLTGAGFGGCIVLLGERGAIDPAVLGRPAWAVEAVDGTLARRSA